MEWQVPWFLLPPAFFLQPGQHALRRFLELFKSQYLPPRLLAAQLQPRHLGPEVGAGIT